MCWGLSKYPLKTKTHGKSSENNCPHGTPSAKKPRKSHPIGPRHGVHHPETMVEYRLFTDICYLKKGWCLVLGGWDGMNL